MTGRGGRCCRCRATSRDASRVGVANGGPLDGDGVVAHAAGRRRSLVVGVAAAGLAATVPTARADAPRATPAAIEVDRDASPGGRVSLGFDGGDPVDAWGVSLAAGWLDDPVHLSAGALGPGTPASQPVRRRETIALGGALTLGDSVVLDGVLRGSHQVGDRLAAAGDGARLARFVFHDLRLGARIRVAGDRDQAVLARGELTLPTGDDEQFAGDARWSAAWSLIGRARLPYAIAIAVAAGIRLRRAEVAIGDRLIGDELFGAASVSVPLPSGDPARASPIQLTAAVLGAAGDRLGALRGASPAEARIGVLVQPTEALAITVQLGTGLDDQIGAPRLRGLLAVAYTPRVVPAASSTPTRPPPRDDEPDDDPDDSDGTR